jgi:2-keto-4-pentenoate hydratase
MTAVLPARFTEVECQALTAQLVAARTPGAPLLATPTRIPATVDDAYRVQDAVMARLGTHVAGWKVGAASPTAEPNCAPIFDGLIHAATAAAPGTASIGVELEIAFKLARGFEAASVAPSRAAVEAAIGSAWIALETCAARLADGLQAPELLRLADNGINHGLVIGPEIADWHAIDANTMIARVEADGVVLADMTAGHTCPDLVGLLTWLVGHCVISRGGIAAGTIVTTGSWSSIRFTATPTTVRGTFTSRGNNLGTLETRISRV